jgi:hypothetical protein
MRKTNHQAERRQHHEELKEGDTGRFQHHDLVVLGQAGEGEQCPQQH